MQPQIQLQIQQQSLQIPLSVLAQVLDQAKPQQAANELILPAAIGDELQGGIYTGSMVEDGKLVHLIRASESLGDASWETAKDKAGEYRGGGLADWYLPRKPEMIVALAHDQDGFERAWHWTSTPYGSRSAWAVDFEYGNVTTNFRNYEFRVRPFRRFIP